MARDFGVAGFFKPDAATLPEVDEDRKLRVGMFMYVLADLFLAIFFIGSYIFLRGYDTNGRWFPPDSVGAIAYGAGEFGLGRGSRSLFRYAMLLAALLYLADGVLQIYYLANQPTTLDAAGSFQSSFVLLAGYHAYHMLLGVFLGIGIVNRAFRGYYDAQAGAVAGHGAVEQTTAPHEFPQRNTSGIASIGYYWYYAALYAVAVWLLLIILPANLH
jgi:heme/copper-type cytochrome/quinol oxidase subunit 3